MLKTILNVVSSGLIMGGVYAIIAMGMSIQYGVARILNVSHGEFIMVGAFLTYALVKPNVNPLLAMVLQIWGSQQKTYAFLQSKVTILGTDIALNRLVVLLFAVAISLLFYLFLQKVRLGKAIRAVSQDASSAALMGVKVHRVSAICFGIGAVLAGCAGSLISIINQFNTSIGMSYTIIAIIVVVLGGMGSIPGSLLGGFILGFIGTLVNYIDPSLSLVAYYLIIIVLLLVKPSGLMGGKA